MRRRNRPRRMDIRLPGGSIARVDRRLDSAQLAALIDGERRWLAQFQAAEEKAHESAESARPPTDL